MPGFGPALLPRASPELVHQTIDTGSQPAVGAMPHDGPFQPLVAGKHLFTFWR